MEKNIAIIDMGSNSVRLVIYYINDKGATYKLDDLKNTIRLSSHIDSNGSITEEGIKLTILCLKQFKQLCEARDVQYIKGVATAALRQAQNRNDVLFEIVKETGIQFQILSGEEEARYGFLAVHSSIDMDEAIIVDIGGGSTEISYMSDRRLRHSVSIPMGAVNITERYLRGLQIVSKKDTEPLLTDILMELANIPWLAGKRCPVIGLGGTARTMASIHQVQRRYSFNSIHNYRMDGLDIEHIYHLLRRTPLPLRREIEGLSSGREDIIVGGVTMFKAIKDYLDLEDFYVSTQGIRDGICQEILIREGSITLEDDIVSMHMKRFAHYYKINEAHSEHVMMLSVSLFRQMAAVGLLPYGEKEARLLAVAAYLHDIGRSINVYNTHSHTFYLLSNVNLPGLTHRERLLVALIASFKKAKILRNRIVEYDDILIETDEAIITALGCIILLARSLDRTASKQVKQVLLKQEELQYVVECVVGRKRSIEIDLAMESSKRFKKYLGFQLTVRPVKSVKKVK